MKKATHLIKYGNAENSLFTQEAFGISDLFGCIRAMLKDGYTYIIIEKL